MTTANSPSTEEVVTPEVAETPATPEAAEAAADAEWNAEVARREAAAAGEEPSPVEKKVESTVDVPAEQKQVTPAPAKTEPAKTESAPASLDDLLAKIPESERAAVKAAFDAERTARMELDHKFRSAQGRLTAAERKGAAPTAAQQPAKKPDAQEEARRKQFKEDYPDVAEMIESLESRIAANALPQDSLEFIEAQRRQTAINEKVDAITTVHKDFVPLVKSQEFDTWAIKQPGPVKRLIASDDPEDVIAVMDLFKVAHPQLRSPSPSASADAGIPITETTEQVALRKRREAQSRSVELPANGGTLPQQLDATSEDAIWQQAAKEADARLARR